MSAYTFTPAENADAEALAAFQARRAKLKPQCSRCGRTLTARELDARQCSNADECLLRRIFAGPRVPDGKPLALAEVRAYRKHIRAKRDTSTATRRAPIATRTHTEPEHEPPRSRVEVLLDEEETRTVTPNEWSGAPRFSVYGQRAQAEADRRAGRTT